MACGLFRRICTTNARPNPISFTSASTVADHLACLATKTPDQSTPGSRRWAPFVTEGAFAIALLHMHGFCCLLHRLCQSGFALPICRTTTSIEKLPFPLHHSTAIPFCLVLSLAFCLVDGTRVKDGLITIQLPLGLEHQSAPPRFSVAQCIAFHLSTSCFHGVLRCAPLSCIVLQLCGKLPGAGLYRSGRDNDKAESTTLSRLRRSSYEEYRFGPSVRSTASSPPTLPATRGIALRSTPGASPGLLVFVAVYQLDFETCQDERDSVRQRALAVDGLGIDDSADTSHEAKLAVAPTFGAEASLAQYIGVLATADFPASRQICSQCCLNRDPLVASCPTVGDEPTPKEASNKLQYWERYDDMNNPFHGTHRNADREQPPRRRFRSEPGEASEESIEPSWILSVDNDAANGHPSCFFTFGKASPLRHRRVKP